ncbi:hypothetical protein DFJ74DRAFT_647274 [Hyaloraphidium curvatum]|nr:hypothetical protein DFJ74DRAFT_647274 [Hyaloraphidium curvatum]
MPKLPMRAGAALIAALLAVAAATGAAGAALPERTAAAGQKVIFRRTCGDCAPEAFCEFQYPGAPDDHVACVHVDPGSLHSLYRRYAPACGTFLSCAPAMNSQTTLNGATYNAGASKGVGFVAGSGAGDCGAIDTIALTLYNTGTAGAQVRFKIDLRNKGEGNYSGTTLYASDTVSFTASFGTTYTEVIFGPSDLPNIAAYQLTGGASYTLSFYGMVFASDGTATNTIALGRNSAAGSAAAATTYGNGYSGVFMISGSAEYAGSYKLSFGNSH